MSGAEILGWLHLIWLTVMIVYWPILLFVIDRPGKDKRHDF